MWEGIGNLSFLDYLNLRLENNYIDNLGLEYLLEDNYIDNVDKIELDIRKNNVV